MFLPTTREEMKKLKWDELDIILVSGDAYIDSSFNGSAVIGKYLMNYGYRVGIIAQPDISSPDDISRLGEPRLFWGVSAGCVDSMVANYTAMKKKRMGDDFTPGGVNNRRPDRATIVYSNLIKRYFKNKPIMLGGIEASLRRVSHYDYWSDSVRKSVLFDAKADYLIYGMGEAAVLEMARAVDNGYGVEEIRGVCYISKEAPSDYIELPSYEECSKDKSKFTEMFNQFYRNCDSITAKGIYQKQDTRYLVQNPPAEILTCEELDKVYNLEYEREVHPYYLAQGEVKAMDTIRYSVTTHRGCYGECNFCAIAVHQGTRIIERSEESIEKEVKEIASSKKFKGYITDVGGPTANMYGIECEKKIKSGRCDNKRCLFPAKCPSMKVNHSKQIKLLKKLASFEGIKKVFVASGIRYDLIMEDATCGTRYLREIVDNHVSGQMKIAPEHTEDEVLKFMGKPKASKLTQFKELFYKLNQESGKKQFLTYYMIAAHPGCSDKEMKKLKDYSAKELKVRPEQVQIFTPTPSTYSTLMYYTEKDPFTGKKIFVEKGMKEKEKQKSILVSDAGKIGGKR